jgi:hypothetical protein
LLLLLLLLLLPAFGSPIFEPHLPTRQSVKSSASGSRNPGMAAAVAIEGAAGREEGKKGKGRTSGAALSREMNRRFRAIP